MQRKTMQTTIERGLKIAGAIFVILLLAGVANAGGLGDDITINGFGHQSYLKSDTNEYVVRNSSDGSFDDYAMGITITSKVNDKIYIRTQFIDNEFGFEVDWGFGEYRFNDNFGFKAGKVKMPYGLYTEIIDVKALQPFAYLPSNYLVGINAYYGAALFANYEAKSGWGAEIDVHGGKSKVMGGNTSLDDFIGGQLMVTAPIAGLRFGFGVMDTEVNSDFFSGDVTSCISSAEYVADRFFARTEYVYMDFNNDEDNTFYVEGGYLVHKMVQPVVRYSHNWRPDDSEGSILGSAELTDSQDEYAFGVNLFLSDGFVVKAEHHIYDGNYNLEINQGESAYTPDDSWSLTAVQVAFMF